jgi:hypothetical protein
MFKNELVRNKVNYILLRYKVESKDLSLNLRLELLRKWILSCVEFDEFEMASALKKERIKLIRDIRFAKIGHKHSFDNLYVKLKWYFRKFKRKFFRK